MSQVIVLWEDQRSSGPECFGPDSLLCACVADERQCALFSLKGIIVSIPQNGNGNVIRELQRNLERLRRSGSVLAVLDRDRAHELLPREEQSLRCFSGVCGGIRNKASGSYELVLLERNIETIYHTANKLYGVDSTGEKPTPIERDLLLNKLAFSSPENRKKLRDAVPSFDRLVRKVLAVLPAAESN